MTTEHAVRLAHRLVGSVIRANGVGLRIVEVEAYGGPGDSASHARFGRTRRTRPMWGPEGRLYIYLCYGLHNMVNVSAGPEGVASAVLVRGAEVIEGESIATLRRGRDAKRPGAMAGPGKVGQTLGLQVEDSGTHADIDWLRLPLPVRVGPRIGIDYASPEDVAAELRFWIDGHDQVSRWRNPKPRGVLRNGQPSGGRSFRGTLRTASPLIGC